MKKHLKQFTVTNQVSTVPTCEANLNEENRIKFVTDLAAISRGKHESANPSKRYEQLLKEAAPSNNTSNILTCPCCSSTDVMIYENDKLYCNYCAEYSGDTQEEKVKWVAPITGSPSRPLEFCPVVLKVKLDVFGAVIVNNDDIDYTLEVDDFLNKLARYSHIKYALDNDPDTYGNQVLSLLLYTNMRACVNAGIPYEQIPYNTAEELAEFKAVRIKAPMFVFNHLVTHTALSKEARSERVTSLSDVDYWLPSDFRIRLYKYYQEYQATPQNITSTPSEELQTMMNTVRIIGILLSFTNLDDVVRSLVSGAFVYSKTKPLVVPDLSQEAIQILFKELGYPKEIYQRTMLEFRYKEFILTGWYNNPQTWKHLFLERNAETDTWKNWTQPETATVVSMIKNVIEGGNAPS